MISSKEYVKLTMKYTTDKDIKKAKDLLSNISCSISFLLKSTSKEYTEIDEALSLLFSYVDIIEILKKEKMI